MGNTEVVPWVGFALFHAQRNTTTLFVDFQNHHFYFVAQLDNFVRSNVFVRPVHFGNVYQTFDTLFHFNERAVVGQVRYFTEQTGALWVTTGQTGPRIVAQLFHAKRNTVFLLIVFQDLWR